MKTLPIIIIQLLAVISLQASNDDALSAKGTRAAMAEIESLGSQAKKLGAALMLDPKVKKDVKSSPQISSSLSNEYSEIYQISNQLIYFENSGFHARQLQNNEVKCEMLRIVVTQHLLYFMKLKTRISANRALMDIHFSDVPLKKRLKEQNQYSKQMMEICFQRIKAMMTIDGLKSRFNDAALACMKEHELIE